MKLVDKDSSIPLHIQLSYIIKDMIDNEELKEGDSIIPERELCNIQSVSRMTVNKAIVGLVSEGILYRVQGKGTFVSKKKEKYQFSNVKGFTQVMREKGVKIKTDILSFEKELPSQFVKDKLNINDDTTKIYKVVRLRYIEDDPFGIEIAYISDNMCNNLKKEMLVNKSLYDVLHKDYNYIIKKANQTIEPIILSKEESEILKIEEKSLALRLHRNSYEENGHPIEYTISIFRSDKYQYEIALTN
ncbi:GntR family transcriptional regulator [Romboutsia ilealis]|uniref:GntR family transcriptional regulator n=1 Tax=Romboutsia faecis TaxID=2764597 RepID=A0ABR7JR74_9FIRM|nr:GntR family transcriptional regulator [Romboutsia faecis]MBC5997379.1 GntR family transcriptional regulator [Romboutsia faecis]MRN23661.1 GntR family transcriptional regulator [Romboutsia ilealis]